MTDEFVHVQFHRIHKLPATMTFKLKPLFLTPERAPLRAQVVENPTPWSEILLDGRQAATPFTARPALQTSNILGSGIPTKARLYRFRRLLWPILFVTIGCFMLSGLGKSGTQALQKSKIAALPISVEGLQFIDASHPNFRV
jgi:hypothetical protein